MTKKEQIYNELLKRVRVAVEKKGQEAKPDVDIFSTLEDTGGLMTLDQAPPNANNINIVKSRLEKFSQELARIVHNRNISTLDHEEYDREARTFEAINKLALRISH